MYSDLTRRLHMSRLWEDAEDDDGGLGAGGTEPPPLPGAGAAEAVASMTLWTTDTIRKTSDE